MDHTERSIYSKQDCYLCNRKLFDKFFPHYNFNKSGGASCPFCAKLYKNRASAKRHVETVHSSLIGLGKATVPMDLNQPTDNIDLMKELEKLGITGSGTLVKKNGFIVDYDKEKLRRNWSFHVLKKLKKKNNKNISESTLFHEDPLCTNGTKKMTVDAISNTGLQFGHLVPVADVCDYEQTLKDSYSLVNCVPMDIRINDGVWKSLEYFSRKLAKNWSKVYVISGAIYDDSLAESNSIWDVEVHIPTKFYKIIYLVRAGEEPINLSFIIPHENKYHFMFSWITSVEKIESATGHRFLANVDRKVPWENRVAKVPQCGWKACTETFLTIEQLVQHRKTHMSYCKYLNGHETDELKVHRSKGKEALIQHLQTQYDLKIFKCNACNHHFMNEESFIKHKKTFYKCRETESKPNAVGYKSRGVNRKMKTHENENHDEINNYNKWDQKGGNQTETIRRKKDICESQSNSSQYFRENDNLVSKPPRNKRMKPNNNYK